MPNVSTFKHTLQKLFHVAALDFKFNYGNTILETLRSL